MSSSEPAMAGDDSYMEDRTHPSAEILKALSSLNTSNNTANNSAANTSGSSRSSPVKTANDHPSEYDVLSAQLAENPHNPEGWRRILDAVDSSGDLEKISKTYDALLKQYPNTARAQIQYLSHFTSNEELFKGAESLFNKFLKGSPWVELWSFYLTYVRRLNSLPAQRDIVRMSYEFALNHIGQDKESGQIWADYIQFIKSGETTTTWEEQQKMDALRKVYHRAVQIPLDNVERLWQDLESFEMSLNKITAKKFMSDLSPAHMQARSVLRQLSNHLTPLFGGPGANHQQEMYLPGVPRFDASDRALVGKWKAYLKWEEGNPLEIDEKDRPTLITRIMGVYRKAVIRMRYFTEIWFMAYTWANSVGKTDEALSFLKAGLEANPSSYLLTFAYAEALEIKKDFPEVHATYEKFLAVLRTNLDKLEQATAADTSFGSNGAAPPVPPNANSNGNGNVPAPPDPSSQNSSFGSQNSDDKPPKVTELQKRRTEYGLAWTMYMRFGRRAEGIKSSRTVFGKARKDRWTPWETYEAAALTEYHCSDDKAIACRVFEKGLEIFADEIDFVQRYLGFLISINDENNARALFERVISNYPPERARPLWERWARYEYQYGDLEAALKLEKRMADVYAGDPPIKRLAQRHIYLGTDAIADRDLGFANARRSAGAGSTVARSETNASVLPSSQPNAPPVTAKRPASPDYGRKRGGDDGGSGPGGRQGDYGGGGHVHKRARASSPGRDRDGGGGPGRWDGGPPRRPPPPPVWDKDDRGGGGGGGPPGHGRGPRGGDVGQRAAYERGDDERPRPVSLPPILSWFVGELPNPNSFDGPVFRTDDLMNLFRNAVIPSASRTKSPPPPPVRGGRPPPDYGPYQGPNSGPRRRY